LLLSPQIALAKASGSEWGDVVTDVAVVQHVDDRLALLELEGGAARRFDTYDPGSGSAAESAQIGKQAVELEERTALRQVMRIDDCAAGLDFLATDASRFFTGHVLPVDGGELRGPA